MKNIVFILMACLLLTSCFSSSVSTAPSLSSIPLETDITIDWKNISLTDVFTDESFRIYDYEGEYALIAPFATWCGVCRGQQKRMRDFRNQSDLPVNLVSVGVDFNEDEDFILAYALEHGFDWLFSIADVRLIDALVDEFGMAVLSTASAPVILVCPEGVTHFLSSRIPLKDTEKLQNYINEYCL